MALFKFSQNDKTKINPAFKHPIGQRQKRNSGFLPPLESLEKILLVIQGFEGSLNFFVLGIHALIGVNPF